MSSWQKAGRPIVTKTVWNERLAICRGCEWWQEIAKTQIARCRKCGCSSAKLLLGTSKCPLIHRNGQTLIKVAFLIFLVYILLYANFFL